MTADDIREYLDWYERNFEYIFTHHEGYKWHAIKVFQDKVKNHEGELTDILHNALSASGNLLDSKYAFSRGMLKEFIEYNKQHPEVEASAIKAFKNLLSSADKTGIESRIRDFLSTCKIALMEYWAGEKKNSYQDLHSASVYLAFMHPEVFYIYRSWEYQQFNEHVLNNEFTFKWGSVDNYTEYIRMCDQVRDILKNEVAEHTSFANQLKLFQDAEKYYSDPSFNLLTQDFIYSVVTYYREEFTIKPTKKVSEIDFSDVADASSYTNGSEIVEYHPDVKTIQRTDYIAKQRTNSKIGNAGEEWVRKTYEPARLKRAGLEKLSKKIDWVSKKSDAYGYDILSYDTDGEPIYIEVKTTNGSLESEFYISDYELAASRHFGDRYRLYRVYDFENGPKIQVIKGCLDSLVPVAITFSIKLNKK